MTEQKQNKSTLEELLNQRGMKSTPEAPEPTQEEIMTQALGDISAQERLGQNPPQVKPIQGEARKRLEKHYEAEMASSQIAPDAILGNMKSNLKTTTTNDQYATETGTIPASDTSPQPVIGDFTPGSQERTPQDKADLIALEETLDAMKEVKAPQVVDINLRRLIEFVNGPEFSVDWVRLHLGHISRIPNVIPSITIWEGVSFEEVAGEVYTTMGMPGYVENVWPSLKTVMGRSIDNTTWTAGVLCTMALFDAIKTMPFGG